MSDTANRSRSNGPSDQELAASVPRDSGSREARVGFFVIVGIISFVVILFMLTDPATLRGRYMLVTELVDAGGVRKGDPVLMRGVNIGRVHDFEMIPNGNVFVELEIDGAWEVPTGSTAQLIGLGLFGGRIVAILPTLSEVGYEEFDTLPGVDEGNFMDMADELGIAAEEVLGRLGQVLDEPTVESVQSSAGEIEALLKEFNGMIGEQRQQVADLTASLTRSAEGLEDVTAAGPDAARAIARADSTMATLNRASASLESVSSSLEEVIRRIEAGEGTLGKLSRDDALYENMNRASGTLADLLADFQENPDKYMPSLSIFGG